MKIRQQILGQFLLYIFHALLLVSTAHADEPPLYGTSFLLGHLASAGSLDAYIEDRDDDTHIHPAMQTSYSYDKELGVNLGNTSADSKLLAVITPGLLRYSWLGYASVAGELGNTNESYFARADLGVNMGWEDHVTISSSTLPAGTPVTILFSFSVHGDLERTPINALYNTGLSLSSGLHVSLTSDGSWHSVDINKYEFGTVDEYRLLRVPSHVGEFIKISMSLSTSASAYTETTQGELREDEVATAECNLGHYDSNRMGIRAVEEDVTFITASGHAYPSHAMSETSVSQSMSNLRINSISANPTNDNFSISLDGIPAASYQLEWTKSLLSNDWQTVYGPIRPEEIGELVMPASVNEQDFTRFWRVIAIPVLQ